MDDELSVILFIPWRYRPSEHHGQGPHANFPQYSTTFRKWKDESERGTLIDSLISELCLDEDLLEEWQYYCIAIAGWVWVCRVRDVGGKWEHDVWMETCGSGESECWIPLSEMDDSMNPTTDRMEEAYLKSELEAERRNKADELETTRKVRKRRKGK
jgi:hypothetical protein